MIIINTKRRGGRANNIADALITPQGVSKPKLVKLAATTGRVTFLDDNDSAIKSSFQVITNVNTIAPTKECEATGNVILLKISKYVQPSISAASSISLGTYSKAGIDNHIIEEFDKWFGTFHNGTKESGEKIFRYHKRKK